MAIVPRKLKHSTVYYVENKCRGEVEWERVGSDKRAAERRDAAMKKEIAAGTYQKKKTGVATVQRYADSFFAKRKAAAIENEIGYFKNHIVKRCPWYAKLKVEDVRPPDTLRLVEELRAPYRGRFGEERTLSEKTVSLIVGALSAMFRDARFYGLTVSNPCELPYGTLTRSSPPRSPYTAAEMAMLTSDPSIDWDVRVFNAIAFYTGQRMGEICGRRWRDLDRASLPLQCLAVESQYQDLKMKTERLRRRPRKAPIHPTLEAILDKWYHEGFEFYYLRKPEPGDFIIPRRDIAGARECLTRSMAYKRFQAACVSVGIASHTVHATRNTFISLCRRGGCHYDALERITHNAKGSQIDQYTDFDWAPLCKVVMCLPVVSVTVPTVPAKAPPKTVPV